MELNVTLEFLKDQRKKRSQISKQIQHWFLRHDWSRIILQNGNFWFTPIYWIVPEYVKHAVCGFMQSRCQATLIEEWLPPAA